MLKAVAMPGSQATGASIRRRLFLLIVAVVVPVALLSAYLLQQLWTLQRQAQSDRILERVSALRLALDTDLEKTVAQLRAIGAADVRAAERLLEANPGWIAVALLRPDGSASVAAEKAGRERVVFPRLATEDDEPMFSSAIRTPAGWVSYVGVPVVSGDGLAPGSPAA